MKVWLSRNAKRLAALTLALVLVLALAACTALGAVGCGRAEEYTGPELILRYAENQPEDYPTTQAALAFADLVAERTEGRVKVAVYSGGGLGAEQSVIEQMQYGGIDVSVAQYIADYTGKTPKAAFRYSAHQHTSKGSVPGINGPVDLDVTAVNYPRIIRKKGLTRLREGA